MYFWNITSFYLYILFFITLKINICPLSMFSVVVQMFVTEVNSHREHIIELDKTGTHLKYFSQKKDVVLIKNLLLSVQSRWEKLVQRSVERGRVLDDARKRAKQVTLYPCLY